MASLIVAEHNEQVLNPATLHAVTAALKLGDVDILVAGENVKSVAEEASRIKGVRKVLLAESNSYKAMMAEQIAPLMASLLDDYRYFAAAASAYGKNLMPRVAALLDCSQISDLTEIIDAKTFTRPIYAGNAFITVSSDEPKLVLTFRMAAFDAAAFDNNVVNIEKVEAIVSENLSRFVGRELVQSERPELTQARIIVSGGRALGSAEQFHEILTPLADRLGAAIGASRAAVDAEYAPNDYQVGQTGKVVSPDLYVAIGISGAIQHVAGIQDSKVIVAINKDPDAPIFNVADFGLVADLFDAVPELARTLKD